MTADRGALLPGGSEVPFEALEAAVARASLGRGPDASARSSTANVVAIGTPQRLAEAAAALEELAAPGGVRAILIATGENPAPFARVTAQAVALDGLRPAFVNNAVASLRLSSLPTLVWWRDGSPDLLEGVVQLADRVVLDVEDARDVWAKAANLFDRSAITDLRWTRLTQWRALMAHFFDIEEVRAAAPAFTRLVVRGRDLATARLFAGWLRSCLAWKAGMVEDVRRADGPGPLESVELGDDRHVLVLRVRPGGRCVETLARVDGRERAKRIVSLGEQRLAALIREELRVRSRDFAFERALAAAEAAG